MDLEIIYAKTLSGEEAMHKRTRVMQRNVRMVLILVDGQSTVADLILKTGNEKLIESALRELEKAGFVEPVVEQDSLWAEGKKVAQEIRDAAVNKARKLSSPGAKDAPRAVEPSLSDTSISLHSAFASSKGTSSISAFSVAPIPPLQFGTTLGGQLSSVFSQQEEKGIAEDHSARADDSKPRLLERVKAVLSSGKPKGDESLPIKPIRRGQRNSMRWPTIIMSLVFGLLGFALLIVFAFPFDRYLPEVEAAFAKASGQRVKIASMRVDVYPKLGLFLGDVRVGREDHELRVSSIGLRPVIGSLFAKKTSFRRVELSGLALSAESIMAVNDIFAALANPAKGVGLESVVLDQVEVMFGGLGLSGMQGEVRLGADRYFQSLSLNLPDRSLSLELKPHGKTLDIVLAGAGWRPSEGSPFLFTSVDMKGRIEKGALFVDDIELRFSEGVIRGVAVLASDKQRHVSGKASFERINAARLGEVLGIGPQFTGEIAGTISYSASSDSWSDLFSTIVADGEFAVRRGSVQGVDLTEAVRRVSATPVEGGKTVFEQLSGKLRLTPSAYLFSGLVLDSGLMQAIGAVEVGKDLRINGKMELQMKGSVNQMRVPVTINGPLKTPTVQVKK